MPNVNGELNAEEKDRILKWLHERTPGLSCPSCRQRTFSVSDHLVAPPVFTSGGGFMIGGPSYPLFLVVCDNCAYAMTFSAVSSGVISNEPEIKAEPAEKKRDAGNG